MTDSSRFLIFSLEGEQYAIPVEGVAEITVSRGLQSDKGLAGVFEGKYEFRGKAIPVLNLKKLLKVPGAPGVALLIVKNRRGELGILVDTVSEILDTEKKTLPMPKGVLNPSLPYYSGVLRQKNGLALVLNGEGLV